MTPRRWLKPAVPPLVLLALNLYIAKDLFFLEYSQFMGSIEAAYIAISRYMIGNWRDLTWFPLWYGGIPFQNTYPPFLHAVVAVTAAAFRISVAHSHHIVTAFFYCAGPIALYALALRLCGSRWYSFVAVWIYSIFTPSLFLMPLARAEVGGVLMPRRFEVLTVYGEGPHITALALIPAALLSLDLALSKRSARWYVVAAAMMAAVALTNWLGAFALAIAVFAFLATHFTSSLKILSIAILAYALAGPWIPPSTILDVRHNAQLVGGDYRGIYGALPLFLLVALLAAALLKFSMQRLKASASLQFAVLFAVIMSAIPLGVSWFHMTIVPQPERYQLEMDLALCLAAAFVVKASASKVSPRLRIALLGIVIVASIIPARWDRRYARRIIKPIDITSTIEYQMAKWFESHVPGGRVMAPGSISFWLNAFTDVPQLDGGFDQGVVNRNHNGVTYQILSADGAGVRAAEIDTVWFRAYGVQAFGVGGRQSREYFKPFQHPEIFPAAFPEGWYAGDDAVYWVPGRNPSLAYVIPRARVVKDPPFDGLDISQAKPYVESLTDPASFHWTNRHSAEIQATLAPEKVVSVQVTFHPGWRASANGKPCRIFGDGLGQIVLDPRVVGACKMELIYDGGWEMKIAKALSGAAWLGCIASILISSRERQKA
ncbi:MAG TPA: hypothetical protein VKT81_28345 [Bryobacteraceae bacterium]|nr:hypothetical protein [Bryobacteraceae bacterium]